MRPLDSAPAQQNGAGRTESPWPRLARGTDQAVRFESHAGVIRTQHISGANDSVDKLLLEAPVNFSSKP